MKFLIKILPLVFLVSCNGFLYEEKIVHNKYLLAIDVLKTMNISISIPDSDDFEELIPSCVFSVGNNNDYIIAKQHPYEFPNINKEITNYYIIPSDPKNQNKEDTKIFGPLTFLQFKAKTDSLGISEISFSKVFKELE